MSVDNDYVRRSLAGLVRMSLHDPQGLRALDLTIEGYFRSFTAIALSAPVYTFTLLGQLRIAQTLTSRGVAEGKGVSLIAFLAVHAVNFLGASLLFLALMIPLSRLLQLQPRYAALTVAYNWGTLLVQCAYLPPVILFAAGLASAADAASLMLIAMGFTLYFRFATFLMTLETPWTTALALALIDLLLQWVWFTALTRLV
jgi:hypothetical protein